MLICRHETERVSKEILSSLQMSSIPHVNQSMVIVVTDRTLWSAFDVNSGTYQKVIITEEVTRCDKLDIIRIISDIVFVVHPSNFKNVIVNGAKVVTTTIVSNEKKKDNRLNRNTLLFT